jgi:hypothetical protein
VSCDSQGSKDLLSIRQNCSVAYVCLCVCVCVCVCMCVCVCVCSRGFSVNLQYCYYSLEAILMCCLCIYPLELLVWKSSAPAALKNISSIRPELSLSEGTCSGVVCVTVCVLVLLQCARASMYLCACVRERVSELTPQCLREEKNARLVTPRHPSPPAEDYRNVT